MSLALRAVETRSVAPRAPLPEQVAALPETRYMGSKFKLLPFIYKVLKGLTFTRALDAFSGTSSVGYLMKAMGKKVVANDHLQFCYHIANAVVANGRWRLTCAQLEMLLEHNRRAKRFISRKFKDLYYSDEDNRFLDNLVANLELLPNRFLRSLALAAACRACVKRRPRGVFTYVGQRYDDGRRDLLLSLKEHFMLAATALNEAVFNNGQGCDAAYGDVFDARVDFDLVYIDTPYVSPHSDNEYTRRYHFLEGLVRYWRGIQIQEHTETKKFGPPPTPFRSRTEVYDGFDRLFHKFADSILVVSYSSNGIPTRDELRSLLKRYKARVEIFTTQHAYSFGTHKDKPRNRTNRVEEYLFVGY